ncbi:S53 family peptidase [Dyella sp. 2HG41-7]|uniref:S53 family peptidase n=1 Tax=Dyella sp. 2HG41-7 TaxID=2883239 RepID=UPI001F251020|nr:S53 family peptidase [Dyella sp. 2HG41-7]
MLRSSSLVSTRLHRALTVAALVGATVLMVPHGAYASDIWANTATQATPIPSGIVTVPLNISQSMHIVVGLAPHNKAQLDTLVAAISTPGNAQFGQVITPQQFLATYAPTATDVSAVENYLSSLGFTNITVSGNNLAVSADGSAQVVESAFNTKLVSFNLGGRHVFANTQPAQVPLSLASIVSVVVGLQNVGVMGTQLALPQNPLTTPAYSGPQFQTAYDAGGTPAGSNTTIGIVTEGDITQVPLDLRQYEQEFNLPQVPYQVVPVGLQTTDTSGLDEWDLDSQSSSGMAGNLQKIVFYNAGSLADAALIPAFERIVGDNQVKAVNMSFGGCESLEYLSGAMLMEDLAFEQGAAEGITFFAASGDGGASCQVLANAGEPVVLSAVEYPAASEYVVAVGGTSLLTNAGYTYNSEIAWISGGGGNSLWESPGPWTNGVIPPTGSTCGLRGVPDIAMDADPNIAPADVVVNGQDIGVGGTSLASPLAVGSWARMETAHNNCEGFAAPILYTTFGQPFGTAAVDFHDIVLGDNFLYAATPGWDFTTGLGSFDISAINAALPTPVCAATTTSKKK